MRATLEASWGDTPGRVSIWHRPKPGKGNPVNRQKWFTNPDQIDEAAAYVESLKDKDVYLAVAVYDQDDRSPAHATMTSSVWCDADLCDPLSFRLKPSRIVKSSEGNGDRWQCWWDLTEAISAADASEIARIIAFAHKADGADQSSWPANKLMRIPGTSNTNWSDEPFTVRENNTGLIYSDLDLRGAYDDITIEDVLAAAPGRETLEVHYDGITPEDLPEVEPLLERVPGTATRLNDLIYKTPKGGVDGWRSEHRYALLGDLLRFGFTVEETLSIAWSRPAADKWREDPAGRGLDGPRGEVDKISKEIALEKGVNLEPPKTKAKKVRQVSLLSKDERVIFERRETADIEYLEWAKTKVTVYNAPYHELNFWFVWGLGLAEAGYVPKRKGSGMPLNFFGFTVGTSSSGKSEGKDIAFSVIRKLYPEQSPDIGGNHSGNALIEQLLERNGKVTMIHNDEGDGALRVAKSGSWQTGIMQTWTNIYDGWIPQQGRVGRKELQIADARGIPFMHMMGTPVGMFDVLDREMFLSGYLARQIWAVGEEHEITEDSLKETQAEGDVEKEYEGMPRYWATRFALLREKMRQGLPVGRKSRPMLMTEEALERMGKVKWEIKNHFDALADPEVYVPASRRMGDNIRKAATLIAMSQGKLYVDSSDVVIAIGYAERWIAALEYVAERISDTYFSKQLDQIEKFISGRESQEASLQQIYVFRKEPRRVVDELLDNLMMQGRIRERPTTAGGNRYYRINEGKKS